MIFPDLSQRVLEPEIMDDPELATAEHEAALAGLARLNWLSFSDAIVWQPIFELAKEFDRPLRILDIASGAGDVLIGVWQRAKKANVAIELQGLDFSDKAIAFARRRSQQTGASITFSKADVLNDELPQDYDVVMCSLFLHHLTEPQAVSLLQHMQAATQGIVLVNDLRRVRLGYLLAWVASRMFTRSHVVHTDALLSIKSAFTIDEVRRFANEAGMADVTFRKVWPCRFLMHWRKSA